MGMSIGIEFGDDTMVGHYCILDLLIVRLLISEE